MTGFIFDMEPDVLQPTCVTGLLFYTQELHVFCAVHRSIESRHFVSSFHRSIARFCQVITVVLVDVPCGSEKDLYTLKRAVAGPAWSQNTRAARAGPASDQRGFPKRGAPASTTWRRCPEISATARTRRASCKSSHSAGRTQSSRFGEKNATRNVKKSPYAGSYFQG